MVPQTRSDFKKFILRKLGAPVIKINVDDDQVEDRIDEALKWFCDYHSEGSKRFYYKVQITQEIMDSSSIPMPSNVIGTVGIFDISSTFGSGGIFNIQYQIALNDLYTLTSQSIIPYFMAFQKVQFMQDMLIGRQSIRYNRHENIAYLDMDWHRVNIGDYLVVDCYQVVDPTLFPDVWSDRWLQRYTEAIVGLQWATNLSKFQSIQMPGGVTFNGEQLLQRYKAERDDLEHQLINSYSEPVSFMMD